MTLSRPSTRVTRWPIGVALMSRHCIYWAQSADDRALGQSDFEGVVFVTFRCSQLRFSCGAKCVFVGAFAVDFGFHFVRAPWFVRNASQRNACGFDLVRIEIERCGDTHQRKRVAGAVAYFQIMRSCRE